MFGMGMPEILLILAIALIVIGPKKLPDLAKSLGRALGEFKSATSDLKESMQIDNELADVKDAFDQLNSDDAKKEKPSTDKNKAATDMKTEEALPDDNSDGANQPKDADSSKPPPSDDVGASDKAPLKSQDDESAADEGRGAELHHAGADRGAEHVGGVVGAQRPAQKQPAGQEEEYGDVHDASESALDGVNRKPVGHVLGAVGDVVDMLDEVAQVGLVV